MEHSGSATMDGGYARSRWLPLARAVWVAVLALTLGLFVAGIPVIAAQLRVPCAGTGCYRWQPSPQIAIELAVRGLPPGFYVVYKIALEALLIGGFCLIATVIIRRGADEPMALLAAFMLVTFGGATFVDTIRALGLSAPLWWWPRTILACLGWMTLFVFFFLFPDGRFVPRWTRWAAISWCAFIALTYFAPLNWPISQERSGATSARSIPLIAFGIGLAFAGVVVAQIHRYRRVSIPMQRQQIKWVVCGFVATCGGLGTMFVILGRLVSRPGADTLAPDLAGLAVFESVLLLLPLSIGVAILRHRLYDIDVLINRALVYGALTACVVAFYVLVVGYLGAHFRTSGNLAISLAATGMVAVFFQPLRERLQRAANRLLYGQRDEPYAVLSRLGQRLEGTLIPEAVLPAVAETVREALKVPYTAIALDEGERGKSIVATAGTPVTDPLRLPLMYQHEAVGELLVAGRAPGEAFSVADRRLLDDLARQAGVAAHAVRLTTDLRRLTAELQGARERLVTAREEERRRLRRDLHDGLGPVLGSLALKLDIAHDLLTRDPATVGPLLLALKTQAQDAVADIRRLVYALRPPALDELGLVGALQQEAGSAALPEHTGGPRVAVEAPECLPPLPAAVEVAAYHIAREALTNAVRHAEASACTIRITLDAAVGTLEVEVCDNGRGLPDGAARHSGVGLASMRERAAELGGACTIETAPSGGTRVHARLPSTLSAVVALAGEVAGTHSAGD